MHKLVSTLLPAVVAGVIAVIGTWGSIWYQNSGTSDQWLRAKKLESYSKVVSKLTSNMKLTTLMFPFIKHYIQLEGVTFEGGEIREIRAAIGESIILAKPRLRKKLIEVHASLDMVLYQGADQGHKSDVRAGLNEGLVEEMLVEMKNELSIHE
jgi:hypothetical protein